MSRLYAVKMVACTMKDLNQPRPLLFGACSSCMPTFSSELFRKGAEEEDSSCDTLEYMMGAERDGPQDVQEVTKRLADNLK